MIKKDKDKPIKIMYFDLETVTLDNVPESCAFFQLAGMIEVDGEVVETFDFNLNPNNEFDYDKECLAFNNITEEDLKKYPSHEKVYDQFIELLAQHINKFDKTDKLHVIGYNNVSFDNPKLREWFQGMDKRREAKYNTYGSYFWANSIDTFILLSLMFIKYRDLFVNFKLATVAAKCSQMGLIDEKYSDDAQWHNAMTDISATRDLFHLACRMFKLTFFEKAEEIK